MMSLHSSWILTKTAFGFITAIALLLNTDVLCQSLPEFQEQTIWQQKLKEGRTFLLVWDEVHHVREFMESGSWCSKSHCINTQKQKLTNADTYNLIPFVSGPGPQPYKNSVANTWGGSSWLSFPNLEFLSQRFSNFLLLPPFNTVLHGVVTPPLKLFSCHFRAVISYYEL